MNGKNLAARIGEQFDIPAESRSVGPRITISGDDRVLIEGHRGLLEYSSERVAAARVNGRVLVKGEGLYLSVMTERELIVTGRIWSVELE